MQDMKEEFNKDTEILKKESNWNSRTENKKSQWKIPPVE
jgi:hypothetical protein